MQAKRGRPKKGATENGMVLENDILIPVTSAYISDLTKWLTDAIKQVSHGTVGLRFNIHQDHVVGYEMTFQKVLKPQKYIDTKNAI